MIAVGATDAEGNFAIQLTADKRLLNKVYCDSYRWRRTLQYGYNFMTEITAIQAAMPPMLKQLRYPINSGDKRLLNKVYDSYRWRRTLQYGYNFMTPADPTNPGGGNGNTGGNNGNTGGNTGNNGATGGNNGNGSNTGSNPNGGSGLGTTGSGLGSLGNGSVQMVVATKLSTISYGTGNHGKTGYLPSR